MNIGKSTPFDSLIQLPCSFLNTLNSEPVDAIFSDVKSPHHIKIELRSKIELLWNVCIEDLEKQGHSLKEQSAKNDFWEKFLSCVRKIEEIDVLRDIVPCLTRCVEQIGRQGSKPNFECQILESLIGNFTKSYPDFKQPLEDWIHSLVKPARVVHSKSSLGDKLSLLSSNDKKLILAFITTPPLSLRPFSESGLSSHLWLLTLVKMASALPYNFVLEQCYSICAESSFEPLQLAGGLAAMQELISCYYGLTPWFIQALKISPELLKSLKKLSEVMMDAALFSYLVKKYVENPLFNSDRINGFLDNLPLLEQAIKLLRYEQELNTHLFPIFLERSTLLESDFADFIFEERDFAYRLGNIAWTAQLISKLEVWVENDKRQTKLLFARASDFPNVLHFFLREVNPSEMDTHPNAVCCKYICEANITIANSLVMLIERAGIEFVATKLLPHASKDYWVNLLDMGKAGWVSELRQLLQLNEQRQAPKLSSVLLKIADSESGPIIKKALELYQKGGHPLLNLIENQAIPLSVFRKLLVLVALKEKKLLTFAINLLTTPETRRSQLEKKILNLIENGFILLAREWVVNHDKTFWKSLLLIDNPSVCQMLRNLDISLHHLKNKQNGFVYKFEMHIQSLAFYFASHFPEEDFSRWCGWFVFCLENCLEEVTRNFSDSKWSLIVVDFLDEKERHIFIEELWGSSNRFLEATCKKEFLKGAPCKKAVAKSDRKYYCQLAIHVSGLILTQQGNINIGLAKYLASLYQDSNPMESHLVATLNLFSQDVRFSDRLEGFKASVKNAMSTNLVRAVLCLTEEQEITDRDLRQVALSEPMILHRQSETTRTCFADAIMINHDIVSSGLLQHFEDNFSLLGKNENLVRGGKSYSLWFEKAAFIKFFPEDHFLNRAREFAIASMGQDEASREKTITSWVDILVSQLDAFLKTCSLITRDFSSSISTAKIKEILVKNIKKNSQKCYVGYIQHPNEKLLGAWVLMNLKIKKLIEKEEDFKLFFEQELLQLKVNLKKSYHNDTIDLIFDSCLLPFIRSSDFLSQIGGQKAEILLKEDYFHDFSGGFSEILANTYLQRPVWHESLPIRPKLLDSFVAYVNRLPRVETIKQEQGHKVYRPVYLQSRHHQRHHSCSLILNSIFSIKERKNVVEEHYKNLAALLSIKVKLEWIRPLLQLFKGFYSTEVAKQIETFFLLKFKFLPELVTIKSLNHFFAEMMCQIKGTTAAYSESEACLLRAFIQCTKTVSFFTQSKVGKYPLVHFNWDKEITAYLDSSAVGSEHEVLLLKDDEGAFFREGWIWETLFRAKILSYSNFDETALTYGY